MTKCINNEQYILTLDNGGTYIKSAIYTTEGSLVETSKTHNIALISNSVYCEYEQETLWTLNCKCIKDLISKANVDPHAIRAVGISAQGSGFYAIDIKGNNIRNAISSSDRRAVSIMQRWKQNGVSDSVYSRIYRYPSAGHLCTILAWLKENDYENYLKIYRLFSLKDYLIYKLSGECVASYDCLSVSGLMNLNTLKFDSELAEELGIGEMKDKFGRLVWGYDVCGEVQQEAAEKCGLCPGTVVAGGTHDVIGAALAMGAMSNEEPFIITGTHGINGYISSSPVLNHVVKNNELFACPNKFLIEEGYPASSSVLDWVIHILYGNEIDPTSVYSQLDKEVASTPVKIDDPLFFPFIRGYRDNPTAQGMWKNLKPDHSRANFIRSVYEGVAFTHKKQIEYLLTGKKQPKEYIIAGGAAKSEVWMHIFADVLGTRVGIVSADGMGTKGAAIVASVAARVYGTLEEATANMKEKLVYIEPNDENHKLYEYKYEEFNEELQNLSKG